MLACRRSLPRLPLRTFDSLSNSQFVPKSIFQNMNFILLKFIENPRHGDPRHGEPGGGGAAPGEGRQRRGRSPGSPRHEASSCWDERTRDLQICISRSASRSPDLHRRAAIKVLPSAPPITYARSRLLPRSREARGPFHRRAEQCARKLNFRHLSCGGPGG